MLGGGKFALGLPVFYPIVAEIKSWKKRGENIFPRASYG